MNAHVRILPRISALALCIVSACLLPACGGGSRGALVIAAPPPASPPHPPPPPDPPPSASQTFCPPPLSGDCVVDPPYTLTFDENQMSGGRDSDHALIVRSLQDSWITLGQGTYRFGGGTTVERGTLILSGTSTLVSDTTVSPLGELWLLGTLQGDLLNHGRVVAGQAKSDPLTWSAGTYSRISGDYRQEAGSTLSLTLGMPLQINGQAQLQGGSVELRAPRAWDGQGYVLTLPDAPSGQTLLHADGGVYGQFAGWTSPGLFVEGSLRYAPNDVYFDLARISVLAVMASKGASDAMTLHTAGVLDEAFGEADLFATLPAASLTATQHGFLRSAASIQHLGDAAQAGLTLDSLSGHGHARAVHALLQQNAREGGRASAHALGLRAGTPAGSWQAHPALSSTAHGTLHRPILSGHDQWIDPRLLLGARFGWSDADTRFDRYGGVARSRALQWNLSLHRRGDKGGYATADLGHSRQQLHLDRAIDLGTNVLAVTSTRGLQLTSAYVEIGRQLQRRSANITPFVAVNHARLRSDAFVEQGVTGLELIAGATTHQYTNADVGLRFERQWRHGDRWMQMQLGAGYRQLLGASDPMRAAFTGTPGTLFEVGMPHAARDEAWLALDLVGGAGERWSWLLAYDRAALDQTVALGFRLAL